MKGLKTINREQAAEYLYQLLQEQHWLIAEKPVAHADPDVEQEAVSFLLAVAEQGASDWRGIGQPAREVVSLLLNDFLFKLMHSDSPLAHRTWQVAKGTSSAQKALSIVAYEIRRSFPHFSRPH